VQDIFGSIFTRTELSEVLTEIVKMDPKFDKEQFLKDCESDFIPNILEAISRNGDELNFDTKMPVAYELPEPPVLCCIKIRT
jgi:import inner membrane translocase subunit TIM44